jgi:hypothetical protein
MQVSLECTHRTQRLFKIQLDARTVLVLVIIWMVWGIMRILRIL